MVENTQLAGNTGYAHIVATWAGGKALYEKKNFTGACVLFSDAYSKCADRLEALGSIVAVYENLKIAEKCAGGLKAELQEKMEIEVLKGTLEAIVNRKPENDEHMASLMAMAKAAQYAPNPALLAALRASGNSNATAKSLVKSG